jgi:MFS transporter, DHA1 family, tetracycline resistance protein
MFTYIGLVLTLVQGVGVRRLVPRLGEVRLIVIGTLMIAASSALIPLAVETWWALAIVSTFLAAGNAFNNPSIMSMISRAAPVERQGEMLGVAQSVGALGRIAGPAAGTYLYGHAGHGWPYATTSALVFGAAFVIIARRASRTGTSTGR